MSEYLKAMQALAGLRMNADRMLAAAPTAEARSGGTATGRRCTTWPSS
jgi:hypothetical protein